ncbi:MAG: hypothetical protein JNM56_20360, partial [Planctomycetia bacterium]|nr:hypothetical protein [Planctomycetia bacterium]
MWTPKRILLLIAGFLGFSFAYGVYAYFLGGVNGLPPLPAEYEPAATGDGVPDYTRQEPLVEKKLKLAFGPDCAELKRTHRLEMRAKGIVLAADTFNIEADGRVKMAPFSLAMFGKERVESQFPEINTVQSDIAYLRFDQPIGNFADMASRKIVGCELVRDPERRRGPNAGGVTIVNNRRTPQRDDDLTLTTPGPMFYEESRQQIWTAEAVHIVDEQSRDKKNPTTVDAIGMDVYLIAEAPDAKESAKDRPAARPTPTKRDPKRNVAITGVKAVALRSDVDMRLYVDSNSGFLAAPKAPADAKASAEAARRDALPTKDLVHIKTQGPFHYDVPGDKARFDVSQHPGSRPNSVEVVRRTGPSGACDQLDCEHLELQFSRKNQGYAAPAAPPTRFEDARSAQLEIDTAHAWGNQVTIASDGECLTAFGNDLVYDARTRQSTLKGAPEMVALKDGHEIRARVLVLSGVGDKQSQQAEIEGPGIINMLDGNTKERTLQARFKTKLVTGKDGNFDVLTLTGDAAFEELEPGQQLTAGQQPKLKQLLQADRLKVWLEPGAPGAKSGTRPAGDTQRHRPHHVEAVGRVVAKSPDMTVHDTDRLLVWFKDNPTAPAVAPAQAGHVPAGRVGVEPHVAQKPEGAVPALTTGGNRVATPAAKTRQPIDLSARSVDAHVVRMGSHNELEKVWCEGNVHVVQAPSGKDDKGVDIKGQTLQLLKFPEGHVLTVTGELAEVMLDKLTIIGPEVNIDQKENKAWVNGLGAMRMPSNADLSGEKVGAKREQPAELTIHWNGDMFFNGKYALYHGGVQAEQENSRLSCQTMQVFLDQYVSLKEGARQGPPARVENLVCDKSVRVEDTERKDGKLLRYQRIESLELSFNNEDGVMVAPGPGVLRLLQLGTAGDMMTPGPGTTTTAKPNAADEQLKLTRINYLGRMFANN